MFPTLLSLPWDLRRLIIAATALSILTTTALADEPLFSSSAGFEQGQFGTYPTQHFFSRPDIVAPRPNLATWSPECRSQSYTFLSPRGLVAPVGPIILDDGGSLVWSGGPELGPVYDFRVQKYNGEQVLTYWSGFDQVRGHGTGEYHILNSAYEEIRLVKPGNDFSGDLHEFLITEEDTALLTVYEATRADLSAFGGPADGWIYDCLFQELDLATDEVLFQWRASEHYSFGDTYHTMEDGGTEEAPWDWFHINSVAKDRSGNYLISARYTHSVTLIDGMSGAVKWILGGKRNRFKDLSGGRATDFSDQHDARLHVRDTVLTLFDNGADYIDRFRSHSRGMRLNMDTTAMTVELAVEYVDPGRTLSLSQGSLQELPNGNVLVGYGFAGAYAEFSRGGDVLCETHYEARSAFESGDVQSYRTFKMPWKASPTTRPDLIVVDSKTAYVSWNGATEVRSWVLFAGDDADSGPEDFREALIVEKTGFETSFALDPMEIDGRYIKIVALNSKGEEIGETKVEDSGLSNVTRTWRALHVLGRHKGFACGMMVVVIGLGVVMALKRRSKPLLPSWRMASKVETYSLLSTDDYHEDV